MSHIGALAKSSGDWECVGGWYSPQAWRVAGGQFALAVGAQRLQRVVSYATHLQSISAPEGTWIKRARVSRGCDALLGF